MHGAIRPLRTSLLAVLGLALAASGAAAQQWIPVAESEWAFQTQYSTMGTFTCGPMVYAPGTTCATSGQSVVLTTEGRSVTVTYHSASAPVVLGVEHGERVSIGELETVFSGSEPFAWPLQITQSPLFDLSVGIQLVGASTGGGALRYRAFTWSPTGSQALLSSSGNYVQFPTPPHPLIPRSYYAVTFANASGGMMPNANGRMALEATVSLVPEPATVVLTAAGLLALGCLPHSRRKSRHT